MNNLVTVNLGLKRMVNELLKSTQLEELLLWRK